MEVTNQKKKPSNPIKFNIQLNEEQKQAKDLILNNPITVLRGQAGSGKTLVACQVALDMLFKKEIEKIVITRPTVAKEEIGFLPGNMKDKLDPWLAPVYANLYMLYNKEKINKYLEQNTIEILPFAFMRGRTLVNTFVIVDEAQNVTHTQMEMVIGRLGIGSKMAICGDVSQIDLKSKKESGFGFLNTIESQVEGFKIFTLKQNHRHSIVPKILDIYKNYND
jgi:phosphate starvation-inducible PhoH-like protein